jgi:Mn-containing catalase
VQWLRSDARPSKGEERSPEGQPAVQSEKPFTHEQHTATS